MIRRAQSYGNQIIFIDGMWGSGKSLLGPLISGFENVEKQKIDSIFEYICVLHFLEGSSLEDSSELLSLLADRASFYSVSSREVNFRINEATSVFENPHTLRYLKNLFKKDDGSFSDHLIKDKPSLNIMSHNILPISNPLINAFKERLKLIVSEKHPIYLMSYWESYLPRVGEDPKEFTPSHGKKGNIPWFIKDEKEYLNASPTDRAIICLRDLTVLKTGMMSLNSLNQDNLLIIPFESFVLQNNKEWINKISNFLNKELKVDFSKKLNIPRKFLEDSNHYSASSLLEEKRYYQQLYQEIEEKSSTFYLEILREIMRDYQDQDFGRKMPWEDV